jgi:transposase
MHDASFYDLHVARPLPLTDEALRRIGKLYVVEAGIRSKPSPDGRWPGKRGPGR